jgi:hypothetical protein
MNQAWHIFKKDMRHLRFEAALMTALVLAWSQTAVFRKPQTGELPEGWPTLITAIAAVVLITRAIHSEAIPGDRQFWLTRPYRWTSLLGAKLAFVLLCVNIPLFVVQASILAAAKFPVIPNLGALLWSQVLLTGVLILPITIVAAVTSGAASFLSTLAGVIVAEVILNKGLAVGGPNWSLRQIDWIALTAIQLIFLIGAAVILPIQYRGRNTLACRLSAIAIFLVPALLFRSFDFTSAMELQKRLSPNLEAASSVIVSADFNSTRPPDRQELPGPSPVGDFIRIRLPLAVKGVPEGDEARIDVLTFWFQGADGQKWNFSTGGTPPLETSALQSDVFMDAPFFNRERGKPVVFRSILYLTLFGKETQTALNDSRLVNLTPQLQCREDSSLSGDLICRTAFRDPQDLIAVRGTDSYRVWPNISYSPFPADRTLNPISDVHFFIEEEQNPALVFRKPLAHFRRNVELRDVQLDDLVVR